MAETLNPVVDGSVEWSLDSGVDLADPWGLPAVTRWRRGAEMLRSLPPADFEPHDDWADVAISWGKEVYHPAYRVYSAGVAGKCRVIYVPARWYHWGGVTIKNLEPGAEYSVSHIDPASFDVNDAGRASGDAKGEWHGPILPYLHDWLIVLR